MDDEVLRLESVTKQYANVVAVDNSSFTVERGSFVTLLGPSGCGKTTTLRLIAGFEQPDRGVIYIEGRSVADVPAQRRPVNTVFQDYALFPHLTVFDNIAFGLRLKRLPRAEIERRVKKALELVRLPGLEKRRPHQLSGGQQQRVALARGLANEPAILVLDEPLSSLDYKLRKEMRVELKRIQRDVNTTFVYVTHDQEEALTLADCVVVMEAGKIRQTGTPLALYTTPANRFVASFIGTANFLPGRIAGSSGSQMRVILDDLAETALCPDTGLSIGTPVVLCVRAENIGVSKERVPAGVNAVLGKVAARLYLGYCSNLIIRLSNGITIECQQVYRGGQEAPFEIGDEVYVGWDSDETLVFERT